MLRPGSSCHQGNDHRSRSKKLHGCILRRTAPIGFIRFDEFSAAYALFGQLFVGVRPAIEKRGGEIRKRPPSLRRGAAPRASIERLVLHLPALRPQGQNHMISQWIKAKTNCRGSSINSTAR